MYLSVVVENVMFIFFKFLILNYSWPCIDDFILEITNNFIDRYLVFYIVISLAYYILYLIYEYIYTMYL
jgi:hypothetical protein